MGFVIRHRRPEVILEDPNVVSVEVVQLRDVRLAGGESAPLRFLEPLIQLAGHPRLKAYRYDVELGHVLSIQCIAGSEPTAEEIAAVADEMRTAWEACDHDGAHLASRAGAAVATVDELERRGADVSAARMALDAAATADEYAAVAEAAVAAAVAVEEPVLDAPVDAEPLPP